MFQPTTTTNNNINIKSSPTTTICTVPRAFFIWRFQPQKNPHNLVVSKPLRKWRRPCFWVAQATPKPSKRTLNLALASRARPGVSWIPGSQERRKGGIGWITHKILSITHPKLYQKAVWKRELRSNMLDVKFGFVQKHVHMWYRYTWTMDVWMIYSHNSQGTLWHVLKVCLKLCFRF